MEESHKRQRQRAPRAEPAPRGGAGGRGAGGTAGADLIVVTHGEFGSYLVEAAEGIVGPQRDGVESVSISSRLSLEEVRRRLEKAVRAARSPGGLVIAVDMPGGTPCNVALPLVKDRPDAFVVSGVNLYMIVTAFNLRRSCPAAELAEKMVEAARRSVADVKSMLWGVATRR